ncbi:unnamed protein product [Cercospora beticola]|nr:unnamed protein product [Cercospora beticola]
MLSPTLSLVPLASTAALLLDTDCLSNTAQGRDSGGVLEMCCRRGRGLLRQFRFAFHWKAPCMGDRRTMLRRQASCIASIFVRFHALLWQNRALLARKAGHGQEMRLRHCPET